MSAASPHGACADLLPQVVDKYFFGDRSSAAIFTGRAICAHCPIQAACLEDAIVEPPGHGMRAGESNRALWTLHDRWLDDHEDADVLAAEAISRQWVSSRQAQYNLKQGRSGDTPLAFPELGGAA